VVRSEDVATLQRWAALWSLWSGAAFLDAYLRTAAPGAFLPQDRDELALLLDVYLLEKEVIALGYNANHRPDWVGISMAGLLELLGAPRGHG
jgi:predicted trehalose synthase